MNARLISAAAVVIALGAPISALAQSYTAPAGISAVTAPGGFAPSAYDDVTTGSLGRRLPDNSAKEGNAEQPNRTPSVKAAVVVPTGCQAAICRG